MCSSDLIGLLERKEVPGSIKPRAMPTQMGRDLGLEVTELVDRFNRPFLAVSYSKNAQRFIVDNIDSFFDWRMN